MYKFRETIDHYGNDNLTLAKFLRNPIEFIPEKMFTVFVDIDIVNNHSNLEFRAQYFQEQTNHIEFMEMSEVNQYHYLQSHMPEITDLSTGRKITLLDSPISNAYVKTVKVITFANKNSWRSNNKIEVSAYEAAIKRGGGSQDRYYGRIGDYRY